jgi:CoA:oxalate CoA-transferase
MDAGPLDGVRVLDLSRYVSGPHCTRMLADLGADVVKVEAPEGDGTRRWGHRIGGVGPYFSQQNCGKRSLSVDLGTDEGVVLVRRLAGRADVLVENFRAGVMDRLGLGAATLRSENPGLVYASITGFGPGGSMTERRAYANVVHAAAGLLERQARRDGRPPTPIRWSSADTTTALQLLSGILAALLQRHATGRGDRVEVAMIDAVLSTDDFAAFDLWDPDPAAPRPDPVIAETADGWVMISANPVIDPLPFCEAMGRPAMADEPRFRGRAERAARRDEFLAEFEEWSRTHATADVVSAAHDAGLAVAEVRSTAEALRWAAEEPRPVLVRVDDRVGGTYPLVNSPQRFTEAVTGVRGVVPRRGEHHRAVLADWLGEGPDEVTRLESMGALVAADPA